MNYSYNVNGYFANAETTLRTNDISVAISEFFEYVADGIQCDIVNGFTGEVLAIANNPDNDDYATDEIALMMLGHLCAEHWGEDDADEPEDEMTTAEGMVLGLIQALGGLPS